MSNRQIIFHLTLLAALIALTAVFYWHKTGMRAVPSLAQDLQQKDEKLRIHAVETLSKLGPSAKQSVPDLIQALHDSNWAVATGAGYALLKIDLDAGKKAVPDLTKILRTFKIHGLRT